LGGAGKTVEADETELTRSRKSKKIDGHRRRDNAVVVSLVERGGKQRSVMLDHRGVMNVVRRNVHPESRLVTDKAQHYKFPPVASHESVDHSKFEWTRGDVHTNNMEGFFSILKRGLVGVYQGVDQKHLHRYLAEFDFRQNNRARLGVNDEARAAIAVQGAAGKRLTYQTARIHPEA
jgi:transposase-like protein